MAFDMVFDQNQNPAYNHTPEETKKWLKFIVKHGQKLTGYTVRVGETNKIVSARDYLGGRTDG